MNKLCGVILIIFHNGKTGVCDFDGLVSVAICKEQGQLKDHKKKSPHYRLEIGPYWYFGLEMGELTGHNNEACSSDL